jgi:hypothetical protein
MAVETQRLAVLFIRQKVQAWYPQVRGRAFRSGQQVATQAASAAVLPHHHILNNPHLRAFRRGHMDVQGAHPHHVTIQLGHDHAPGLRLLQEQCKPAPLLVRIAREIALDGK